MREYLMKRSSTVDYSSQGIEWLREDVESIRQAAVANLPESQAIVILLSHIVALLTDYRNMKIKEERKNKQRNLQVTLDGLETKCAGDNV